MTRSSLSSSAVLAEPEYGGTGAPGPRRHRRTSRNSLVGTLCGMAVLALVASVALAVSGRTITIGSAPASATPATESAAHLSAPAPGPSSVAKVITRWRTRTVTSSAMATVRVLDPTGTGVMDQGWQADIPCVYEPSAGLLLGDGGAAAGAVNETCTLTVVQLQPSSAGQAVILKGSAGHEQNFALTAAS